MKSKVQFKFDRIDIILIFIILILVIITLTLYSKKFLSSNEQQEKTYELTTVVREGNKEQSQIISIPKTEQELIKYLATLSERDRMEYYCGEYFKLIENKEYEKAYNLLYDEFKKNYFPTLESFTKYVEKTYPDEVGFEYDDISRQGYIYVLRLKVLDVLGSKDSEKIQRVVIKENSYNNYVLSFQVI